MPLRTTRCSVCDPPSPWRRDVGVCLCITESRERNDSRMSDHQGTPAETALRRGVEALNAGALEDATLALREAETLATASGDFETLAAALREQSMIWRQRSEWDRALDV